MTITEEKFLKDVEKHQMIIINDDGINRHIRFKIPDSMCMHFDLITWPGYLCYCGDMGTYVFSRLDDMFNFFRNDKEYANKKGKQLYINKSYWAEKIQASDRTGYEEFSLDLFKLNINDVLDNHEASKELRDEVEEQILNYADYDSSGDEYYCYKLVHDFNYKNSRIFEDFFEYDCIEYTYRFVWCCYALAWGIGQYDNHKELK